MSKKYKLKQQEIDDIKNKRNTNFKVTNCDFKVGQHKKVENCGRNLRPQFGIA